MIKKLSCNVIKNHCSTEASGNETLEYLPYRKLRPWRERLSRNLALAGMLLLAISAVRNAQLPSGETVLTAVQQIVDQNWDDSLGKISFVSNFFPDSAAVFFEITPESELIAPCVGMLSHVWNENEPYIGYYVSESEKVFAIAAGKVMSVAHGNNEENIIRIAQDDGLETLYYLEEIPLVNEGDQINSNTCIGKAGRKTQIMLEVRKNGLPINPTDMMIARNEDGV